MRKQILGIVIGVVALFGISGYSHAALIDRGGGMIFDDDRNITWLQNADLSGAMTWDQANTWANNLVYGGFDNWRLPTALNASGSGPCRGNNCTDSEIGHLYYIELRNGVAYAWNRGPFINTGDNFFWTSTPYAPNTHDAWEFYFPFGHQGNSNKGNMFHAWAVRDGDVSAVPEPGTLLLLGSGLVGLIAFRRKISR